MAAAAPDRLDPTRYNLLCEFAVRHPSFHRAELESVLSLSDIVIGRDCDVVELPSNPRHHDCDHDEEGRAIMDEKKDKDKGESEGGRSKKRPRGDAASKQAPVPGHAPHHLGEPLLARSRLAHKNDETHSSSLFPRALLTSTSGD